MYQFGHWQWHGAGWWFREHHQSGWLEWRREGGWTPGEGGHRSRPPRDEGCICQLELPFSANWLCRLAACPHDAYVALQAEVTSEFRVTLKTLSST